MPHVPYKDIMNKPKATVAPVEKIWLSSREAEKYLGMGCAFMARMRRSGQLPYSKIAHSVFYLKADIDRLLLRHMTARQPDASDSPAPDAPDEA